MMHGEMPSNIPAADKKETVLREALPFVRESYAKAEKMMRGAAINPRNFVHPYGEQVVEKDVAWTEKIIAEQQSRFDVNKAHADIVEAILYEHIEQSNWFGEKASTIKTSQFDDLRNGVDLIVEFEEAAEGFLHMGLAVDVTFGEMALQDKIQKIKREIEEGKLAEIKYFESDRSPYKGLYRNLPRVVVGMDRSHMVELMKMWIDDSRKKEFATHPVQMMILHEIRSQLMRFSQYAAQCGREEVVGIYNKQLSVIGRILKQKSDMEVQSYEKSDGVHSGILKQLELF